MISQIKQLPLIAAALLLSGFAGGNSLSDTATKACTTPIPSVVAVHTRNWSQIFLASLSQDDRGVHVKNLTSVTHRPGYNNQPAFSRDGRGFYYSWRPDGSEADVWYHEFRTGKERAITCTSRDEYSPALIPTGEAISAVSLEDADKRRLWKIPLRGGEPSPLFPDLDSVAYYAWADADTVILNLTNPGKTQSMTLAVGRVSSRSIEQIGSGVSQSLARVPSSNRVSYVDKSEGRAPRLMEIDPVSHRISVFLLLPEDVETYAWLPDGRLLAPKRSQLLIWSAREGSWKTIADLREQFPHGISRLVIDEKGSRILLVAAEK